MNLDHMLSGFVIFVLLTGLLLGIYNEFDQGYTITERDLNSDGETIAQALYNLEIIQGINQTVTAVFDITNPTNVIDIVGSLLNAAVGAVRTIVGIVALPLNIFTVIFDYYTGWIPDIFSTMISLIFSIYVGIVLLRWYSRGL